MHEYTSPEAITLQQVKRALADLAEVSGRLQARLRQLPGAASISSAASNQHGLRAALDSLAGFWAMREDDGLSRRDHYAEDLAQAIRHELRARIARGNLHAVYQRCLPQHHDEPGLSLFSIGLRLNDEHTATLHGAIVFVREDGPTLLYLSGTGLVGAPDLSALLRGLTGSINRPELRQPLIDLMPARHRGALQAIGNEPSLELEAFEASDWILTPTLASPFHTLAGQLIDLQQQDLSYALGAGGPRPAHLALQRSISDAITVPVKRSPIAIAQALRRRWFDEALREPDWLLRAPAEQREQCLAALQRYDHLRLALLSAMNGCMSIQDYARSRLKARIANDLGLDIDPDQVQVATWRSLPITGERYQTARSLTRLAIDGLHPGDRTEGSPFLTGTRITWERTASEQAHSGLSPAYVGELITQLAVPQRFNGEQRRTHALESTQKALGKLMREHLTALGWLARLQGHVSPTDQALLSAFCAGQPPEVGRLEANRVTLADRFELQASLVIRHLDAQGSPLRLLVYCADAPAGKRLMAFDGERQLVAEWVGWTADAAARDVLLANVLPHDREAFSQVLKALQQRPFPERPPVTAERPWYNDAQGNPQPDVAAAHLYRVFMRLEPVDDAIAVLTRQHVQMAQAQADHDLPPWLTADASSHQQLVALDDQLQGACERYASNPHTAVPDFERYVHDQARGKINALLARADGSVDPDSILIRTPREILTYTQMLRDGYDDSISLHNPAADTTATFSGPPGIDVSALTPERVAGSVRGAWLADHYVADIERRLLAPTSPDRTWRRQQSVLILRLQMQRAALRARLKGTLAAADYQWITATLSTLEDARQSVRQRHPVYPLQFELRNPLVASAAALGEAFVTVYEMARRLLPGPSMTHLETLQGCYIVTPQANTVENAWAYTPNAPDGLDWRRLDEFRPSLALQGMGDYYKDRCSLSLGRLIAFFLADIRNAGASQPPAVPATALSDLADSCHDAILQRRIDDVRHATTARSDMIANIVWSTVELAATAVTLPFPLASFAVGAALALQDYSKGVKAFADGNQGEASLMFLSALLNGAGAVGDLQSGLKGFGHLLRDPRQARAMPLLLEPGGPLPVPLPGRMAYAGKGYDTHVHEILQPTSGGSLAGSGRYARQNKDGAWQCLDAAPAPRSSAQAYAIEVDLSTGVAVPGEHAQGVVQVNGRFCIALEQQCFQVQYAAADKCWYIVDPANPFSFGSRRPVVRNAAGQWSRVQPGGLLGGAPTGAASTASVTSAYELPAELRNHVLAIASPPGTPAASALSEWAGRTQDTIISTGRSTYARLRATLERDASAWYEGLTLPPRTAVSAPTAASAAQALIEVASRHNGIVIAETLNSPASKKLLIDSMPRLAEQGVSVVYLEHLLADIHTAKLQKYKTLGHRARCGSRTLKHFYAFAHDGLLAPSASGLDYYHLIKAAHRHGIEVRPLNTSISYDFGLAPPLEGAGPAARMRGYIANRVIEAARQAAPQERWIALMDHRLALANDGVPGVAQVQGVASVRVEDAARPTQAGSVGAADMTLRLDPALPQVAQPGPTPGGEVRWTLDPRTQELHVGRLDPGPTGNQASMLKRDVTGRWIDDPGASLPVTQPTREGQLRLWDSDYQLSPQNIATFHKIKARGGKGLDHNYFSLDSSIHPTQDEFFSLRSKLQSDSQALLTQALPPRPELPDVSLLLDDASLLHGIYEKTRGLVVGEAHAHLSSKKFIIDNLETLQACNVKTLYLEHLLADANQLDLDHFMQTGIMSRQLLEDLRTLDWGHRTDPAKVYNFEQLVVRARDQGLEVRAIDCAASYRLDGMGVMNANDTTRQRMMNFYASRTIERHQQAVGPHNWIALVGNTHANTYQQTVPGLAELQGAIGIRVFDAPAGQGHRANIDPGELGKTLLGRESMVKCDLRMAVEIPAPSTALNTPAQRLRRPGQYLIDSSDLERPCIWHRSRDGNVFQTAITTRADGKLEVDRPSWTTVHGQLFDDLPALTQAMRRFGLVKVD